LLKKGDENRMSHIKYSMILDRTFIENRSQMRNHSNLKISKCIKIHFLTFRMKDGFENHRILEIFFDSNKKNITFLYQFYYDPDVGTWERKEVRHLSKNPLYDIKPNTIHTHQNTVRKKNKNNRKHVLQHKTIRNLPLFK
jgi:hypothetical protein